MFPPIHLLQELPRYRLVTHLKHLQQHHYSFSFGNSFNRHIIYAHIIHEGTRDVQFMNAFKLLLVFCIHNLKARRPISTHLFPGMVSWRSEFQILWRKEHPYIKRNGVIIRIAYSSKLSILQCSDQCSWIPIQDQRVLSLNLQYITNLSESLPGIGLHLNWKFTSPNKLADWTNYYLI